eukprot:COSAG03_NODE_233_length_10233_cov_3.391849_4_plen_218_part_00
MVRELLCLSAKVTHCPWFRSAVRLYRYLGVPRSAWPHTSPGIATGRLHLRRKVGFCNQTFALPILSTDWVASGKVFGPPADWERVCWWGKAWHKLWSPVWLPLQLPTEKLGVGEVRRGGLRGQDGVHPGGNTVPVRCHPAHASFTEGCPQREEWSADSPTQLTGEARAAGVPPGTNAMEVEWVGGWSELRRGPASCLALCGSGAQRQPRRARGDKGS